MGMGGRRGNLFTAGPMECTLTDYEIQDAAKRSQIRERPSGLIGAPGDQVCLPVEQTSACTCGRLSARFCVAASVCGAVRDSKRLVCKLLAHCEYSVGVVWA